MNDIWLHVLPKLGVGFLIMVVYIHLSGKGALAPISTIDQVGNVVLGAIIGGTLYNHDVSVLGLIVVAGVWAGMLLYIRYLSNRRMAVKDIVDGKPIRLMQKGELITDNFSKAGLAIRDFIMLLHQRGYSGLDELESVWYEYNGQLTVVKKGEEAIAVTVIENGEFIQDNLEKIDLSEAWLKKELKKHKAALDKIFCAEWHHNKLWIYPYCKEPEAVDGRK